MIPLWLDTETFSECDLKVHSTHRYAEHPSTEVIVAQWALDDGEPCVADLSLTPRKPPAELVPMLRDPNIIIVAQNSHFDRTMLRHVWGIDVPVERWRDTMVMALAHGLPGGLEKIGAVLGHAPDEAKDKRGRELIQLFCKPRPKGHKLRRATRYTHPAEWADFLEYSRQDIVSMRAIARDLPTWNYREPVSPIAPNGEPWMDAGARELALWHLDQRINDRGFAVDLDLARAAIDAVATEQARLKQDTIDATNGLVSSPSKRDALLAFILAEYGVTLPDMKADTLRRRMEDPELPEGVKLLLGIRLEATKTSTAKYKALVNATSADGRLRNTLQFAGAQRTTRWAGRVFQPQNLPRYLLEAIAAYCGLSDPTDPKDPHGTKFVKERHVLVYLEHGVAALKGGFASAIFDDVMALSSNLVRSCIVAPPFKKLCIADLSNIEGRGLVFLSDEQWKLRAFAEFDAGNGPDMYKLAFGRAFNVDPADVTKAQRQIGKVMELGLGYEGGVAAFLTFAAVYNMDLDELANAVWSAASAEALEAAQGMLAWTKKKGRSTFGLSDRVWIACETLVLGWREAHPNTKALWAAAKEGVTEAIRNPGQTFAIGKHLKARKDGAWLRIRLPSGRYLCYLQPKVDDSGQITYMGVDQYSRQWKRIKTYGGKLVENCTQAFARDVMAHNMPAIDAAGYQIVLSVHDELLTETPDTEDFTADKLSAMLATVPPWARGIPLAAAGFETPRYRKD